MQHPSREAPQLEDPATFDLSSVQSITIEALKAIREGLDLLGQHLAVATADIAAEKVPDLNAAIECWSSVRKQHSEAERALGVSSPRVADLEAALARQAEVALAVSELSRCRSIVHMADSNFVGCAVIRTKCDELEAIAGTRQALDSASLRAVAALLQLIETGDNLDDEQATEFQIEVEQLFGKSVATAALRGKLGFEASFLRRGEEGVPSANSALTAPTQNGEQEIETLLPTPAGGQLTSVLAEAQPKAAALATPGAKPPGVTDMESPAAPSPVQATSAGSEPTEEAPMGAGGADIVGVDEAPDAAKALWEAPAKAEPSAAVVEVISAADYESFTGFCSSHWVNASGSVGLAPWKAEGIVPALAKRAVEAWDLGQAAIAYLFARGVVTAGGTDPLGIDDLANADRLLSDPASHTAGIDARRVERLRSYIANPAACDKPNIGLVLMLEALRPTHPCSFTPPEIETLIDRASYNDPALNEVVRFLLQGWSAHLNPLSSLRARLLDAPEESVKVVEAALRSAQDLLRTQIATLWIAAGGRFSVRTADPHGRSSSSPK